jgi:lipopolysaccharide transport system permease protein
VNINLLINFTKQELVDRYAGSVLGAVWTFIFPLVNILIFTLIFSKLMGARLPGASSAFSYSIYLIPGIISWNAFANTVMRSSNVFIEKGPIISKVRIFLPYLPLYIVLSESVIFLISLVFFIVFLILTGTPIAKAIVLLPFIYALQQIFAYTLGLFLAILNVFVRDVKEFTSILLQTWFWLTPIVYAPDILSDSVRTLLAFNPAYMFIEAYHDIFVFNKIPNLQTLAGLTIVVHVFLMLVYLIFRKLEKDIRDFI